MKKKNPNKPNAKGEENWKLCDKTGYCFHCLFSSNRLIYFCLTKLIFVRKLPTTGNKNEHRVGNSFLLEFLSTTEEGREHLWIMDPGNTLTCCV